MKRRFVGGESVKNRDNNRKQNSLSSNFRIPPELIGPTFPCSNWVYRYRDYWCNSQGPTGPQGQEDYKVRWGDGPDRASRCARDTRISWANRCNWARRTAGPTRIERTTRRNWSDRDPRGARVTRWIGPTGATGAQGIQGIQGLQGPIGATGPEGLKEFKASKGYRV